MAAGHEVLVEIASSSTPPAVLMASAERPRCARTFDRQGP
jgi:hypothetical protein